MNIQKMFDDQRLFNQQIWSREARSSAEYIQRFKDLIMGMVEEATEFLRTYDYKPHRRSGRLQNEAHSHEELVDMFKYWLSLADAADFPIAQLEEMYYRKSMVVQYRYQEEWAEENMSRCVVVDIDNVLADYISGICSWALAHSRQVLHMPESSDAELRRRLLKIREEGKWIDHTALGLEYAEWNRMKHHFRTNGGKRALDSFPDARPFLRWCRGQGFKIILITSRPVDRYPNIFADTLWWLNQHDLMYDHVWWATDKATKLLESHINLRSQIAFAVDDDQTFCDQFMAKGIKTYLLSRKQKFPYAPAAGCATVNSLDAIIEQEKTTVYAHHVVR